MCALLWHQVHLYCRATTTTIILCLPKPKPSTHWTVPPHPCFSSPWQPPFCFLSLWISLLWLLYLSGITQYLPFESESESVSFSAVSDSLWPHGLYSPRDSPGQNTGWVAMPSSRGSSQPGDRTCISHIAGRFFIVRATWETPFVL